jgi:hypothetical protein
LRAAGTKTLRPPAQQDEMLAQFAHPLLHGIRRQKIILSVLAFIRREGGRTSTKNPAGCPTACCGEESGAARRAATISAWPTKQALMPFMT